MARRTLRTSALVLLVIVVAAAAAVAGFVVTRDVRGPDPQPSVPAAAPSAYAAADDTPSRPATSDTAVTPATVTAALRPDLTLPGLGRRLLASVVDARSGTALFAQSATTGAAPASTVKISTAVAALSVLKATDRITTTAVSDGAGTVALVGGGDPTLSAAAAGVAPLYPQAARLSDLAEQVRRAGVTVRRVVVVNRFAGPAISPAWAAEDVPSSYGSGITSLMADGGRAAPGDAVRSATPDLDAGRAFARLAGAASAPVSRGAAPAGARTLGTVESAPVGVLVEQMLLQSDNVIADCLARQVAFKTGRQPSFLDAAVAVRTVLRERAGVEIGGGLVDASGLAASDRIAPVALTSLLHEIVVSDDQGVRGIANSLPVAGWSGSLIARYVTAPASAGAGLVRAKTGTLTGVSTLAGFVHTRKGGLVAFAFYADRNSGTPEAQAALDTLVSRLATCAC